MITESSKGYLDKLSKSNIKEYSIMLINMIDVTDMLTDDIAAILIAFKDDPKALNNMIERIDELPYAHQLDIIKFLVETPEDFQYLCENSCFAEYMDAFATRVFPNNLKDE